MMELIPGLIRVFVGSFIGTLGFGILLHAPQRAWMPSSLLGGAGFALYWLLMQLGMGEPGAIFLASLMASLIAQFCARKMRMIATVFITLSILALVPGLGLYQCMERIGQGQNAAGLQIGATAMIAIMMIALGLAVGTFLFRALAAIAPHHSTKKPKEDV